MCGFWRTNAIEWIGKRSLCQRHMLTVPVPPWSGAPGLAVASGTRFPDEAARLLAHMTTGEGAARMARDSAHPVAGRPDLWLTDERRARGGSVFVDLPRTADRVGDNSLGSNHRELLETVVEPQLESRVRGGGPAGNRPGNNGRSVDRQHP